MAKKKENNYRFTYRDFIVAIPQMREKIGNPEWKNNGFYAERFVDRLIEEQKGKENDLIRFFLYLADPVNGLKQAEVAEFSLNTMFRHYTWDNKRETAYYVAENYERITGENAIFIFRPPQYVKKIYGDIRYGVELSRLDPYPYEYYPYAKCPCTEINPPWKICDPDILIKAEKRASRTNSKIHRWDRLKRIFSRQSADDSSVQPHKTNVLPRWWTMREEQEKWGYIEEIIEGKNHSKEVSIYPHDIVHGYSKNPFRGAKSLLPTNDNLEREWRKVGVSAGLKNTLVSISHDGLMDAVPQNLERVDSNCRRFVRSLEVATTIQLLASQGCSGFFRDKVMLLSDNDTINLADISSKKTLHDRLKNIYEQENDLFYINLDAFLSSLLTLAKEEKLKSDEMPSQIIFIRNHGSQDISENAISKYAKRYADAGYKLPAVIFWDILSRGSSIDVIDDNVFRITGYTPTILQTIKSGVYAVAEDVDEKINQSPYDETPLITGIRK